MEDVKRGTERYWRIQEEKDKKTQCYWRIREEAERKTTHFCLCKIAGKCQTFDNLLHFEGVVRKSQDLCDVIYE